MSLKTSTIVAASVGAAVTGLLGTAPNPLVWMKDLAFVRTQDTFRCSSRKWRVAGWLITIYMANRDENSLRSILRPQTADRSRIPEITQEGISTAGASS